MSMIFYIKENNMTVNAKRSSPKMASLASAVLHNKNASKIEKSLAGSVLAQSNTNKESSHEIEELASFVLSDSEACAEAKSLAGSVLAQSKKDN